MSLFSSYIIRRIVLYNFKLQIKIRYKLNFLNDYLFNNISNIPLVIEGYRCNIEK